MLNYVNKHDIILVLGYDYQEKIRKEVFYYDKRNRTERWTCNCFPYGIARKKLKRAEDEYKVAQKYFDEQKANMEKLENDKKEVEALRVQEIKKLKQIKEDAVLREAEKELNSFEELLSAVEYVNMVFSYWAYNRDYELLYNSKAIQLMLDSLNLK